MKSNYVNLVIWLLSGSLAVSIALAEEQTDVSELNAKFQRLYATKQFNQAAPIAEKILQITEETRGPEDRKTAVAANNLAEVYRYMGQYAKAEPLYERALKVFEKELGPEQTHGPESLAARPLRSHGAIRQSRTARAAGASNL